MIDPQDEPDVGAGGKAASGRRKKTRIPPEEADAAAVYERAVALLARREHSRWELQFKLQQRGFLITPIEQALDRLTEERLLSEARFAEMFARSRVDRGWGPLKIRSALGERRVSDALIEQALESLEVDWYQLARDTYLRRYAQRPIKDYRERAKRQGFLQRRGFTAAQCRAALNPGDDE